MIGVLGGSFDPVHYGHLHLARSVQLECDLSEVFLMPCAEPVHKSALTFSATERLTMLKLALVEFATLKIDTQELERAEPSYMIDSLRQLRQKYAREPIALMLGMDSFNQLPTWKDADEFAEHCHLIISPRPNIIRQNPAHSFKLARRATDLHAQTAGLVYFAQTTRRDVASSAIRSLLFASTSDDKIRADLQSLVPATLFNYLTHL